MRSCQTGIGVSVEGSAGESLMGCSFGRAASYRYQRKDTTGGGKLQVIETKVELGRAFGADNWHYRYLISSAPDLLRQCLELYRERPVLGGARRIRCCSNEKFVH
ncbi:MAG: hypothetical protein OHK0022_22020 [Roseiflexaceae bacterium]